MATACSIRPMAGLKSALRQIRAEKQQFSRWYATTTTTTTTTTDISTTNVSTTIETPFMPPNNTAVHLTPNGRMRNFHPGAIMRGRNNEHTMKNIPIFLPDPSPTKRCKDPIAAVTESQLSVLDPNGARARLFSKANRDRAQVGDILLVRLKSGDPFAGVCLNIRRTGIDTAILLRNQLTRVGVEMWYKIFSPNVEGIEVVQRKEKRARRAKLYYMRQPRHDIGSVENIVKQYQRQRAVLRSSEVKSRDANSGKKQNKK